MMLFNTAATGLVCGFTTSHTTSVIFIDQFWCKQESIWKSVVVCKLIVHRLTAITKKYSRVTVKKSLIVMLYDLLAVNLIDKTIIIIINIKFYVFILKFKKFSLLCVFFFNKHFFKYFVKKNLLFNYHLLWMNNQIRFRNAIIQYLIYLAFINQWNPQMRNIYENLSVISM